MSTDKVIVRHAVRHDVAIRAQVSIRGPHATSIRLSAATGVKDGWIDADAVDFSLGGVGVISTVFIPRPAVVRLRMLSAGEHPTIIFEGDAVVRRVVMTDRRPAYHIGTSFHQLSPEAQVQAEALNAMLAEAA